VHFISGAPNFEITTIHFAATDQGDPGSNGLGASCVAFGVAISLG
jgi:hypothetical protein